MNAIIRMQGWSHSKFGKLDNLSLEDLFEQVTADAIANAGLDTHQIDEVFVSHYNHGLSEQGFPASLPISAVPQLRNKPATHVENACASGSAAVHQAARSIQAGDAKSVLVIGVEKMTDVSHETVRHALIAASHVPTEGQGQASFAGLFAQMAQAYFKKYGDHTEALARIAAKNHSYGSQNPLAHMQRDLGFDFCFNASDKNPVVAAPLKRTDCSMVSDGAAALVLTDGSFSGGQDADIRLRSKSHVSEMLPLRGRDITKLEGCSRAWKQALQRGEIEIDDLDFIETHDCFTIAELLQYEAMGLAEEGRGADVLKEGDSSLGGRMPINLSGGLKSKGHPIGATGVSMHIMAARQLAGDACGVSLDNARLGGVFNMGGAGVANYCSILERLS